MTNEEQADRILDLAKQLRECLTRHDNESAAVALHMLLHEKESAEILEYLKLIHSDPTNDIPPDIKEASKYVSSKMNSQVYEILGKDPMTIPERYFVVASGLFLVLFKLVESCPPMLRPALRSAMGAMVDSLKEEINV